MMFQSCSFEKEVARTLKDGHWPDGCAPELRTHVATCASCADFVLVTQTFQRAKSNSVLEVPAGSPGLLWWKAQLRRRNALTERVSRPINIAQSFAFVVATVATVIFVIIFITSQYRYGLRWAEWFSRPLPSFVPAMFSGLSAASGWNALFLILGVITLAFLSGIVIYLAAERS